MSEVGERSARGRGRAVLASAAAVVTVAVVSANVARRQERQKPSPIAPPLATAVVSKYPDPPGIVIHDSDSPGKVGGVAMNAARLEAIHKQQGYGIEFEGKKYHIAYHYVILPDGTVERGRPDHCEGAHAPMFNRWLGVCLIGAFSTNRKHWWPNKPPKAQLKALRTLCEELMSKYHIPPELVKRHRDVTWTWCPGDNFPYKKVLTELETYAKAHPETRPTDGRSLVVIRPTPAEVRAYQKRRKEEEARAKAQARASGGAPGVVTDAAPAPPAANPAH